MSSKTLLLAAAAFVALWAILGFMDVGNAAYSGYQTDFDNTVAQVTGGGPAAAAGMRVGDRIRSVDGVSVEDSRAMSAMPRPAAGQTRTIVVDRDGATEELTVTFAAQPFDQRIGNYVFILIGLAFVGLGLWAYLAAPARTTKLLAISGVFFGIALTGGPYLGTSMLANLVGVLAFACVTLAFATLLHFMIVFPDGPEPNPWWVYGPAAFMGLFFLVVTLLQPDATSGFNRFVQVLLFLWIVGYLGLTLIEMVRTWARASSEERSRHGLGLLLAGTGIGLGILLLNFVVSIVAPTVTIPGGQWLGMSLVLVPIACAVAAVKSARAGGSSAAVEAAPA